MDAVNGKGKGKATTPTPKSKRTIGGSIRKMSRSLSKANLCGGCLNDVDSSAEDSSNEEPARESNKPDLLSGARSTVARDKRVSRFTLVEEEVFVEEDNEIRIAPPVFFNQGSLSRAHRQRTNSDSQQSNVDSQWRSPFYGFTREDLIPVTYEELMRTPENFRPTALTEFLRATNPNRMATPGGAASGVNRNSSVGRAMTASGGEPSGINRQHSSAGRLETASGGRTSGVNRQHSSAGTVGSTKQENGAAKSRLSKIATTLELDRLQQAVKEKSVLELLVGTSTATTSGGEFPSPGITRQHSIAGSAGPLRTGSKKSFRATTTSGGESSSITRQRSLIRVVEPAQREGGAIRSRLSKIATTLELDRLQEALKEKGVVELLVGTSTKPPPDE